MPRPPPWAPLMLWKKSYRHFPKNIPILLRGCKGGSQIEKTVFFAKNKSFEVGLGPNLSPPCSPPGNGCHIRVFWVKPNLKHIYNFLWKCVDLVLQLQGRETNQIPHYDFNVCFQKPSSFCYLQQLCKAIATDMALQVYFVCYLQRLRKAIATDMAL